MRNIAKPVLVVFVLTLAGLGLSACGQKGPLRLPPEAPKPNQPGPETRLSPVALPTLPNE